MNRRWIALARELALLGLRASKPSTERAPDRVYEAVAERRRQFDMLVWQVPVLAFALEGVVIVPALDPDTTTTARATLLLLGAVGMFLSLALFLAHREGELTDSHWLNEQDLLDGITDAHGKAWAERRRSSKEMPWFLRPPSWYRSYMAWALGLAVLCVADLAGAVISVAWPDALLR